MATSVYLSESMNPTKEQVMKELHLSEGEAKAYLLGYARGYAASETDSFNKGYKEAKEFMLKEMERIFREENEMHEEPRA